MTQSAIDSIFSYIEARCEVAKHEARGGTQKPTETEYRNLAALEGRMKELLLSE